MGQTSANQKSPQILWGTILTTAAVGALAFALFKRVQETSSVAPKTVEDAMRLCDRAVEALDHRIGTQTGSFSMAG
jgi:hypothetical protein